MRRLAFVFAAALLPGVCLAQAPSVAVRASETEVTLGERFTLEVTAAGPEGTAWTFPVDLSDERVEALTASRSETPLPPGTWRYDAAVFALGKVSLPSIRVRYRLPDGQEGEVATEPLSVSAVSVLSKDPKDRTLAEIRGPEGLSVGRAFYAAVAVAALLLGVAGAFLWRRRRRTGPEVPAVPERPPDVEAREALAALVATGHLVRGELRAFYIALADIAKRYLERRLQAPVLEMTTAEMVAFLGSHEVAWFCAVSLRELAGAADEVKFARGLGLAEQAEQHLAVVRGVIETIEAKLREPKPEEKVA